MNLGEFREQTKDLPDNAKLVCPTNVNVYSEARSFVSQTLVNVSLDGSKHNAYHDLGIALPEDEYHPTVVVFEDKDEE